MGARILAAPQLWVASFGQWVGPLRSEEAQSAIHPVF